MRRLAVRWLRIPPDPQPPAGSEASIRVFRAAPAYRRYILARWALRQLGVVVGLVFALAFGQIGLEMSGLDEIDATVARERVPAPLVAIAEWAGMLVSTGGDGERVRSKLLVSRALRWGEFLGVIVFLAQLPLTLSLVLLDYDLRFYIVTDKSLRIREGVSTIREVTMTFANIQNLTIEQGPAQRLLGIADLRVRSAGGGPGSHEGGGDDQEDKSAHVAYFRGLDNAHELRGSILGRLGPNDAGLGDPHPRAPMRGSASELAAAGRILDEARALRAAISEDRGVSG